MNRETRVTNEKQQPRNKKLQKKMKLERGKKPRLWLIKLLIKNKLENTLIKPNKIKIYWEFIMKTLPKKNNCEDKKVII